MAITHKTRKVNNVNQVNTGGGYNRTKKLTRRARLVGLSRSNSRWHLFSTATAMFSVAFLVTFLCSSILAPARNTNAETVTESSSASGYTLSLSATPVVNLNVGVLEVPVMTVGVGTVSTSTTAPGGYKLYLSMAGTSNDLRRTGSDGDTISATTGTMADSSALGIGEWGYAIPSTTPNISATDFDTSYDIMESAYPSSKGFAAPPISTATAELITSTEGPNEKDGDNPIPDDIDVYYGINADNTTPIGNYTGSVVWTAVADAAQTPGVTVSPASGSMLGGDSITIVTTLFSLSDITGDVYMLTDAQYQQVTPSNPVSSLGVSPMTCNKTSATAVTFTCTTPASTPGNAHIYVDIPRFEKSYVADFTYNIANFTVTVTNSNTSSGASSLSIPYGGSTTVKVTPINGYLSAVSCPSGYTCSGYNTGASYMNEQTVTVKNNNTASGGTLAFTGTTRTISQMCSNTSANGKFTYSSHIYKKLADNKCYSLGNYGTATWANAGSYCPSGASIPSLSVWQTLMGKYSGGGLAAAFELGQGNYWSSTSASNTSAYYIYMGPSGANINTIEKTFNNPAMGIACVVN